MHWPSHINLLHALCLIKRIKFFLFWHKSQFLIIWRSYQRLRQIIIYNLINLRTCTIIPRKQFFRYRQLLRILKLLRNHWRQHRIAHTGHFQILSEFLLLGAEDSVVRTRNHVATGLSSGSSIQSWYFIKRTGRVLHLYIRSTHRFHFFEVELLVIYALIFDHFRTKLEPS